MTIFPPLIPSTRTYSPGAYPHTVHGVYDGSEARVRHSNTALGVRLRLFFPAITTAELLTVISHYAGQSGRFLPFAIPNDLLSGVTTPADLTPAGHQWRYSARPTVEDISIVGGTNRHNLTIELETVPPENTIAQGARLRMRSSLQAGSAQLGAFFDVYAWLDAGAGSVVDPFLVTATLTAGAASSAAGSDADADAYIAAVEAADGASMTTTRKTAIDDFVVGCKGDGIWSLISSSAIFCGASTLAGALIPLKGPTLTNNGFVSGDYNAASGLVGNASSKYLSTNVNASSLGNTSHHLFFRGSTLETVSANRNLGGVYDGSNISSLLDLLVSAIGVGRESRSGTAGGSPGNSATILGGLTSSGTVSSMRTSATSFKLFQGGSVVNTATNSNTPSLPAIPVFIFARNDNGTASEHSASRLQFFSVGSGLSDALMSSLSSRVETLIAALQ